MSFPRYPSYKDSGVEWLGEVPGHWKTSPLKAVSTHNDDVLDETTTPDAEIVYVDISSVDGVNGVKTKETMLFAAAPSRARRRVRHGDVIVSTVRTYLKAIARIRDPEENLIVSTGFAVIRPRGELTPDFLGCLVSASYFVEQVIARSTGVSYPAINASELVAIPVPVPPIEEQTQIAAFLDRETAKIDELVAEQRRLMELLKEKRQAVISHAVTQGMNPDAPMKPSGIEWLGDVPAHWEVVQFKQFVDIQNGSDHKHVEQTEGYPVLGSGGVFTYASEFLYDGESVLLGRKGTIDKPLHITGRFWTVDTMYWTKISPDVSGRFTYYLALTIPFDFYSTNTALPSMTKGALSSHRVAFPPLPEQTQIAAFLDSESAKFDTLTTEAQRAINLLQERRTALISAAVTGQIDVRPLLPARKVGAGETATQEASKLVNLPHENHT